MSLLRAHLVFVTKFRRNLFTDPMLTFAETDRVHLLVAYPPTLAFSVLAQRLKGRTAYAVRREYIGAWSPSYFAVACGGAPLSIIEQAINGQPRPL